MLALGALAPAAGFVSARTWTIPIPAIIRTIQTQEKTELGEFYVVRQAVSNNGPGWSDTILDVRDEVGGVRVREIRIAPLNRNCAHIVTVKAVETVLPNTTSGKSGRKI